MLCAQPPFPFVHAIHVRIERRDEEKVTSASRALLFAFLEISIPRLKGLARFGHLRGDAAAHHAHSTSSGVIAVESSWRRNDRVGRGDGGAGNFNQPCSFKNYEKIDLMLCFFLLSRYIYCDYMRPSRRGVVCLNYLSNYEDRKVEGFFPTTSKLRA